MESPEFLPLGSVCSVKGNTKKLMVIARGLALQQDDGVRYFDYGACLYPEGLIGDQLAYFNHDAIQRVVAEGYADEDDALHLEALAESLSHVEMKKGDPAPYKMPGQ
jgi:hypothetical protein